ncbi:MAG: cation transporter [Pseudomonadota bacterium]
MRACCEPVCSAGNQTFRRALIVALWLNAAMFAVELAAGFAADSSSLLADAADFAGDAANYGLSLWALALAPVWRSRAALIKGLSMGCYGIAVLGVAAVHAIKGTVPKPETMGIVALVALAVNVGVALMLYRHRNGDANARSVWLCSRNDAIGNVAVMLAAAGVFGTGSGWPDVAVAALLASLALASAASVVAQARREILSFACASESSPAAPTAR